MVQCLPVLTAIVGGVPWNGTQWFTVAVEHLRMVGVLRGGETGAGEDE